MKIIVDRFYSTKEATISRVFVDGEMICFGLEDEHRTEKVYGETRIPAGNYQIQIRTHGGFHNRYKNRFDFHRGILGIKNVPGFSDILIHVGNTEKDTAGCLLVGLGAHLGKMTIQSSVDAYKRLYLKVIDAAMNGNLSITIMDND